MIFEIVEHCNDQNVVTVLMDNYTFNQVMKMITVEAYHKGLRQEKPDERNEDE